MALRSHEFPIFTEGQIYSCNDQKYASQLMKSPKVYVETNGQIRTNGDASPREQQAREQNLFWCRRGETCKRVFTISTPI